MGPQSLEVHVCQNPSQSPVHIWVQMCFHSELWGVKVILESNNICLLSYTLTLNFKVKYRISENKPYL